MLDVICPILWSNADLFQGWIDRLEQMTDIRVFRVIAVVDGGTRSDFAPVESALRGSDKLWTLLHEDEPKGRNHCIREAMDRITAPMTAIIHPQVILLDDRWLGKIQRIFTVDPRAAIVSTRAKSKDKSLTPVRTPWGRPPDPDTPMTIFRSGFLHDVDISDVDDIQAFWHTKAHMIGNTTWFAGGVSYDVAESEYHRA